MKIIFGHQYANWYNVWDLISISVVFATDHEAFVFSLLGFYMEIWFVKKRNR